MSLQLHEVRIDTRLHTKTVTVLAATENEACKAASRQPGGVIRVTYLGRLRGCVLGDTPWLEPESLDSDGGDL